jgi:ribosomal-protein-alanine N-acetyltransferase
MTVSPCEILPATMADLSDILKIEEACFSAPWTRKMLEAEMSGNQFAHFLVARHNAEERSTPAAIVGYLCFWIVFEEVRLMNLAVIESMRHRGIARSLVATALQTGISQSAVRAVLEVRSSNRGAQALYRNLGFQHVSIRPKYYSNPLEDAVLMELEPIALGSDPCSRISDPHGGQPQPL